MRVSGAINHHTKPRTSKLLVGDGGVDMLPSVFAVSRAQSIRKFHEWIDLDWTEPDASHPPHQRLSQASFEVSLRPAHSQHMLDMKCPNYQNEQEC